MFNLQLNLFPELLKSVTFGQTNGSLIISNSNLKTT